MRNPMDIRNRIRDRLRTAAQARTVTSVRIGLGYTAVVLDNGQTGLAFTFHRDMPKRCSLFSGSLPLEGRSALALLNLIGSSKKIETAVGMATANALANVDSGRFKDGDILDFIKIRATDRVGMVGMFGPLIGPLRKTAGELIIFEKEDRPAESLQPDTQIPERLPDCQIALITATSIINHTMDQFLHCASNCREVVVLGASTPLVPEVFKDMPVTCLSGVVVSDPSAVLQVVSSAGGMRQFKGFVKKVNLRLR